MYRGGRIIFGLLILISVVTFPFFYNMGKADARPVINLDTPAIQQLSDQKCVEPKEYMRENHMQLLLEWRDSAVREGKTVYINSQGKVYDISLQDSCLKCHNDSSSSITASKIREVYVKDSEENQFCYSCHDYVAVEPNCWSCHPEPKEAMK